MRPTTKVLVLGAVVLVVALTLGQKYRTPPAARVPTAGFSSHSSLAVEPVPASYAPSTAGVPRLAAVGARACIPCKAMAPIRAELRREYAGVLAVDFYDVWQDPDAGRHFGVWVIPTLIAYDGAGREVGRLQGFTSKADVLTNLKRWGIVLQRPTG